EPGDPRRPEGLRRGRPRRRSGRGGALRARYGPRGPRRRIGEPPPHVRGAAPSGAFSGGVRRHALPAPTTRATRAPPSPRRGLSVARPREGILPPGDGGPPAAGGARPRGLVLGGPTRPPRRGRPPDRVRGPRGRGGPAHRRRTGVRGERSRGRSGGRVAPRPAGFAARRPPRGDADVPRKVRRCAGGPRAHREIRDAPGTASGAYPTGTELESPGILP